MDTAALLLTLRAKAFDMSFAELAEKSGLNVNTLYRTLGRNGNPRLLTLVKLCRALNVQLSVRLKGRGGEDKSHTVL